MTVGLPLGVRRLVWLVYVQSRAEQAGPVDQQGGATVTSCGAVGESGCHDGRRCRRGSLKTDLVEPLPAGIGTRREVGHVGDLYVGHARLFREAHPLNHLIGRAGSRVQRAHADRCRIAGASVSRELELEGRHPPQ